MSSKQGKTFSVRQILDNQRAKRLSTKFRFLTENSHLLQTRTHNTRRINDVSWIPFCQLAWRHSRQRSSLELELLSFGFAMRGALKLLFLSLLRRLILKRQIHFCAGAWLGFKRLWRLKQRKGYCGCINGFPLYYAKSEWIVAESGDVNWISPATFWEVKIKHYIMTVCMLSALRRQHVCNLEKNWRSDVFMRNGRKAKRRSN